MKKYTRIVQILFLSQSILLSLFSTNIVAKDIEPISEEAVNTFLQDATITETSQAGVILATNNGVSAFSSSTQGIDLSSNVTNNAVLTGDLDLNVVADSDDNVIIANDGGNIIDAGAGDDYVSTGAGNDAVSLGAGNDHVEVDGNGIKNIDGGQGNDTFVIRLADEATGHSDVTFTGLNRGDSVRVTIADNNGDGVLSFSDVDVLASKNGSLMFNLTEGSSFTLDGVSVDSALNGDINYSVIDNDDGTWDVVIS